MKKNKRNIIKKIVILSVLFVVTIGSIIGASFLIIKVKNVQSNTQSQIMQKDI